MKVSGIFLLFVMTFAVLLLSSAVSSCITDNDCPKNHWCNQGSCDHAHSSGQTAADCPYLHPKY